MAKKSSRSPGVRNVRLEPARTATQRRRSAATKTEALPRTTTPRATPVHYPDEQLDLPVTFDAAGNPVSLREVIQPGYGTIQSFATLPYDQRAELTIRRIKAQPQFEVAMIDGGLIDKARAIREISSQSSIGKALVVIEQRLIDHLMPSDSFS